MQRQSNKLAKAPFRLFRVDPDSTADLVLRDSQMSRQVVLAPEKRKEPFLISVVPILSMAAVSGMCHQLNIQRALKISPCCNCCISLQDAIGSCKMMLKKKKSLDSALI